jgi:hypothetical protein
MSDGIDREDDAEYLNATVPAKEPEKAQPKVQLPAAAPRQRAQVSAHASVTALVPQNLDEAWRMAEAFWTADMVPSGLKGKNDGEKEIKAKLMLAICKGAEVGFAPVTAVGTIMVVNGKACLYGDGASSLVQRSGVVEYIKTEISTKDDSGRWGEGYKVTVSLKRKDQTEPYVRSFSYEDAKRARLTGKSGPWTDYPERQCYWRAWSWAARDGASDALMGLAVVEEVRDFETEAQRAHKTDTSDLEDPPQIEAPKHEVAPA